DTDDEGSDGGPGGEDEDDAEEEEEGQAPEKPAKKRRMDDCIADIEAFYKTFEPFRYARCRAVYPTPFETFVVDCPGVLLGQILTDEERLLRRTQTKRSSYRVLGDPESSQQNEVRWVTALSSKRHNNFVSSREVDPRGWSNVNELCTVQWLEIQKLRNKVKRKVDTKASKGRKIRYDVIPKLVNYMAPVDSSTYSEEAK
ncbi:apoptosis antagonizing transcription factor, putative, partial [Ixodes scapularis]